MHRLLFVACAILLAGCITCAILLAGCKGEVKTSSFARDFADDDGLSDLLVDVSYSLSTRGTFPRSNSLYVQRRVRLTDVQPEGSLAVLDLVFKRAETAIAASGGIYLGIGYGGDPREYAVCRYRTAHVYGIFTMQAVYRDDGTLSELILIVIESRL